MKKLIFFVYLSLMSFALFAQQDAMYSQYMFNTLAINPAYAGSRNVLSATGLYRAQWIGIEGAPRTATFTLDAALNHQKVGLGLQLFNDRLGISRTTGAAASYAYRLKIGESALSFGIQGSLRQFVADYANVPLSGSNPYDPAFAYNLNKLFLNVGTGVYFNSDKFYAGISAQDLVKNRLVENVSDSTLNNPTQLHVFFNTGLVIALNQDFKLRPSVLVKAVKGAPVEGDLGANFWIKDVVSVGAMYRTSADIVALLEIQATPQLRFGYSYDHSTTALRGFNSGSHEFMIRFEFGSNKGKVLSPRYF